MANREVIRLSPRLLDANRDQLMAWARANGLDPKLIPESSTVAFEDGKLTVEQYVRGEKGGIHLNEEGTAAERTTLTVDLVEPFPPELLAIERLRNQIEGPDG